MPNRTYKLVVCLSPSSRNQLISHLGISLSTWYRWAELGTYGSKQEAARRLAIEQYGAKIKKVSIN